MELQDLLTRLRNVRGPNANGEYQARCPAHDDRTASLCIARGEKGIVMKCQAGCDTAAICESLGIKLRDLFYSATPAPRATSRAQPKSNAASGKRDAQKDNPTAQYTPREYPTIADAFGRLGVIDKVYDYTDASGKVLFYVVRIRLQDGKAFRQCRPAHAAQREPVVMGVLDQDKHVLYRLPEVVAAIAEHRPVIVVEGEKDADNLAALGYCATTCSMGAGKWHDACSAQLRDADVYVMGDNDEPGREHAKTVAEALMETAASVHLCDICAICPTLPPKGDISDALAMTPEGLQAQMVNDVLKAAQPCVLTPALKLARAQKLYNDCVRGYGAKNCCIVQYTQDNPEGKQLTTFIALPTRIVERDDGVNVEKSFIVDGWARGGRQLPTVEIPASKFAGLSWITEKWDFAANLAPGNTVRDRVRFIVVEVGARSAAHERVYAHTGWRRIDGKWAYLYQGGAIGADGVSVDLGAGLSSYTLECDSSDGRSASDVAMDQWILRQALPDSIYVPLISAVYLAPLREFLGQAGFIPGFALYLLGTTGTRKSTAAALALSFFGSFNAKSLPASFNDTSNYIRKKAFLLKDAPIVVDDYHPETSLVERRRMESTAQALARAFGDGAERGRMRSDLGLQESMPPRSIAIISGEDMPNIGESGQARFYVVNINRGDIEPGAALSEAQQLARNGTLRRIMRGYIEYIRAHADELPDLLARRYVELRAQATKDIIQAHGRAPETVAHLMLGYELMFKYMRDIDAVDDETAASELQSAWRTLITSSREQSREAADERPTQLYLRAIAEMLQARIVRVKDLNNIDSSDNVKDFIGYKDSSHYYLIPGVAYRYVCKLYADQGSAFPLGERALYKALREYGLLIPGGDGKSTRVKRIGTNTARYITIPLKAIDGDKGPEQLAFVNVTGHDPDNPYENGGTHET